MDFVKFNDVFLCISPVRGGILIATRFSRIPGEPCRGELLKRLRKRKAEGRVKG